MAPKNKKSRFGNPAKAAADAAVRGKAAASTADVRLERAMESLSPGFVAWLESQSRPNSSIDASLIILDDFFDMYRMVEPQADPTALVPEAVSEVMEVAGHANPLAVLGLRGGVRDYVDYLAQARLWTGTPQDWAAVQAELTRTGPDFDEGQSDDASLEPQDHVFADVYIPELTQEEIHTTLATSPMWKNTVALLQWIGEGKELTEFGALRDRDGATAVLVHSGLGKLGGAAAFTTPQDHDAARFAFYWGLLDAAELITIGDTHVHVMEEAATSLDDEGFMLQAMRDLIGYFILATILEGAENGVYEQRHLDMGDWLIQCASRTPPESAVLIRALAEPETVHPDLLSIAQNVAHWAEEGLVTVGDYIEVPAAYRLDVFDVLLEDFPINISGPGAPRPTSDGAFH